MCARPTQRTTLSLIAILTMPAQAGLVHNGATRNLDAFVTEAHATRINEGLGFFAWSGHMTETNDAGATTAKVEHESITRDNLIKSTTTFSLFSVAGSPGFSASGSSISSSFAFTLTGRTTFELLYSTTDNSQTIDAFNLSINNGSGATIYQLNENRQVQGNQLITLAAGSYTLSEISGISGVSPESFGRWSYTTSYILRVVPTPTTLAAFTPLGILATRRRR